MKFTLWSIFLTSLIIQVQNKTILPTDLGTGINPFITTLTDGRFLIYPFAYNPMISIYNADGSLSHNITLQTHNFQDKIAVALSDDSFVLCYVEYNGHINLLYTQKFHADGTPLSEPSRISYDNTFDYHLTGLNDGGYVIVWTVQYSLDYTFSKGLVFNPDNSPRGKQFLIHHGSLETWQSSPVATSLASGQFFITWNSYSIYGQIYNPDGIPKGEPILINTNTSAFSASATASLVSGQIIVTWQGWDNQIPQTFRVYAQMLNPDGSLVGDNFLVQTNEPAHSMPLPPAVGALHNGRFVISWFINEPPRACSSGLYFQLYEADASPIEGPVVVHGSDTGKNGYPQIAVMQDGGFILTFQSCDTSCEMLAHRYDGNGVLISFVVTDKYSNETNKEERV